MSHMDWMKTSLRNAPSGPTSKEEMEAMRRRAWIEHGVAVIRPSDLLDEFLRQAVVNAANRLYGNRQ